MPSADAEIERHTLKAAADWHAVWAVVLGFCALAWPAGEDLTLNYALAVAAAPGLVGQLARLPGWATAALPGRAQLAGLRRRGDLR